MCVCVRTLVFVCVCSVTDKCSPLCRTRLKSEEQTVSQLLQSLRSETKRVETLETELRAARER